MAWLIEILKIYLEEWLMIKYYVIKYLILLKIQNMIDGNVIFSDKKASGGAAESEIISNQELVEELNKPIIRKFKKRKARSFFKENICCIDVGDMQFIIKFNRGFSFYYVLLKLTVNMHVYSFK